ncbi:MAG TPA: fibronectin type III domain-containing protein [Thermoanaerobaculia bacterium]
MGSIDDYVYAGGVNTTSYTHTGRSPATTYFYNIKAEGNPDSAWTSIDSATTAPSGLSVAATSNSAIGISWTGNAGNSYIHGYTYALATNSSFSGASYNWVSGNGTVSTSKTGLATATTYWLKIKAEGTSDTYDSPYGSVVKVVTMPGNLTATVVSNSQVNLAWSGNAGNADITGYTVATSTNNSFTGVTYQYVSGAGSTTLNKTGLTSGTTYYFAVKAEGTSDPYDSAFTAFVPATPGTSSIPNPPSGLSASAVSSSRIDLSWTDNSGNETGFELKRATDSGFTQNVLWIGNIQGTTYSNVGLNASTTYYYMVRAEGTAGKSTYSSATSATTPGTPVSGIPPHFFGINAWMPAKIANDDKGGKLEQKWLEIEASGVKIMRYGGIAVDRDANPDLTVTKNQYLALVDSMRSRGIEPLLQVPYWGGTYTAQQAAALVSFINGAPNSRGVKYWSIGNEPDLDKTNYPYKPVTTAKIAGYIRSFSAAMKAVDPTIRILGPELTWGNPALMDPRPPALARAMTLRAPIRTPAGITSTSSRSTPITASTEISPAVRWSESSRRLQASSSVSAH